MRKNIRKNIAKNILGYLKDIINWVSHIKYLESIFEKFQIIALFIIKILILYFYNYFKVLFIIPLQKWKIYLKKINKIDKNRLIFKNKLFNFSFFLKKKLTFIIYKIIIYKNK